VSSAEVAAIVARLDAAPLNAHDAQPASPAYPYVIVYADGGISSADRVTDTLRTRSIGWQTTVVGQSAAQCRLALDRTITALEGWRPTVTGRSCSRVAHEGSQPVRKDDEFPDRLLFIATDQWRVVSEPA
jgi:hypothetical protein